MGITTYVLKNTNLSVFEILAFTFNLLDVYSKNKFISIFMYGNYLRIKHLTKNLTIMTKSPTDLTIILTKLFNDIFYILLDTIIDVNERNCKLFTVSNDSGLAKGGI